MPTYCDVFERKPRGASPSAMKWRATASKAKGKAASKSYCNYLVPIFWLFETWCHVPVTRNSKSKSLRTPCVQHFRLIFVDRRIRCWEFVLEFLFTVYVRKMFISYNKEIRMPLHYTKQTVEFV